jgi:hypothetical protein
MPNTKPKAKQIKDSDNKIQEPNVILKTEHQHKNWFNTDQMGRQGGRPINVPREIKKEKGSHRRSSSKGR